MNPFSHTGLSISDSLKSVRKSVLIYETIINLHGKDKKESEGWKLMNKDTSILYKRKGKCCGCTVCYTIFLKKTIKIDEVR